MATCPNKNLDSWKSLVSSRGEDMSYYLWDKYNGQVPKNEYTPQIKPGVEELFDSNPDLANQVYSKILTNSGISGENLLSLLLKDNIIEKQC